MTNTPNVINLAADLRSASFQYQLRLAQEPTPVQLNDLQTVQAATELAERYAAIYQPHQLYQAGSLAFQRLSHRLVGISVGAWLLSGHYLSFDPTNTFVEVTNGAVSALCTPRPPRLFIATAEEVMAATWELIDPIMVSFHQATGVGVANLRGNVAASIGGAVRNLNRRYAGSSVQKQGELLFEQDSQLRRLGWFETLTGENGTGLFFFRNSCCHWHSTGAENCDWCCRRTVGSRREAFKTSLDGPC